MQNEPAGRVLVAARPQIKDTIRHILQDEFALEFCHSMAEAIQTLRSRHHDLVLCTLQFDSSRMFELLRHMKNLSSLSSIPFIGIKISGGILSDNTVEHVLKAAKLLGANECINLPVWRRQFGDEQAYARLRTTIRDMAMS